MFVVAVPLSLRAGLTHLLFFRPQESQIEALLEEENIDLLVLARYMQVFSPDFCSRHCFQTVNIHHSFLPAFEGSGRAF